MEVKYYVVVATSCSSCDEQAVGLFDHKPNEEEQHQVEKETGGMFCVTTTVFKVDLNCRSDSKHYRDTDLNED